MSTATNKNIFTILDSEEDDEIDCPTSVSASNRSTASDMFSVADDYSTMVFDINTFYTDDVKAFDEALKSGKSWYDMMYPNNEEIKEMIRQEKLAECDPSSTNWTTIEKKKKPTSTKKNSKSSKRK